MAKKNIFGSSISMSNEFNFKGSRTEIRSKGKPCAPARMEDLAPAVNTAPFVPLLMGAIPVCSGNRPLSRFEQSVLGAMSLAGTIQITQDPNTMQYMLNYALSLLKVVDGASAKSGRLSEDELKKIIMALMVKMLENAGPGYANWNQMLKDLMQNATLGDFLKGVQSAICVLTGDPVNANTGNFIYEKEDLSVKGRIPLSFKRFYNRLDKRRGSLGAGWCHNYEIRLLIEEDRYVILWDDGREEIYRRTEEGGIEPLFGCICRLTVNEKDYTYHTQDGTRFTFNSSGSLISSMDTNGKGLTFQYNKDNQLTRVSNGNRSMLQYQYDRTTGYLISVCDHTGRTVTLSYELGRLKKVTNAAGTSYQYDYGDDGTLYRIHNPRNICVLENTYDDKGRTVLQTFADGGKISYDYQEKDSRTLVTQQDDSKIAYYHDERFRNVKTVYVDGEERFSYNDRNQLIRRVDKNGNQTKFAYDDRGNRTQVIYPDGSKHNMTYDAGNRLLVLSVNGVAKVKNSYDSNGNLQKTEDALGNSKAFRYDAEGNIAEIIREDESRTILTYDDRGNITTITDAQGNTTAYHYDELNRVIRTLDGNGNPTAYQYDVCDQIKKVTNADGKHRSYEYTKNGKVSKIIDFNGAVISQIYNSMNQVETVLLPDGGKQSFEYDLMQNLSKWTAPNGAETIYRYNQLNQLEQMLLPTGGTIAYEYDAGGNKTGITDPDGNRTIIEYDEMNRATAITGPSGARTEYEYDMDGNLICITNPKGRTITYTYNEAGQKIKETDLAGNVYSYEYNQLGKLSAVTDSKKQRTTYEYKAGGILSRVVHANGHYDQFTYDKNNNVIRRENHKGDFLEFQYDCLNRMTCVTSSFGQRQSYTYDPVGNTTSMTDTLGNVTQYTYSPGGKLTSVLDAAGNRTEYEYDAMGALITICRHGGKEILLDGNSLADTQKSQITRYERNRFGNIQAITNPLGLKEYYDYNLSGQLIKKTDRDGYQTGYTYTPAGDVETITYYDGRSVELSYDSLRQLTEIKDWLGITRIQMDEFGRVKTVTDHKGREVSYEWNKQGQQEAILYPDGRKVSYEYDERSRLIHLVDGDREIHYSYKEDGQLIAKHYPDEVSSLYDYNEMGLLSGFTHQKGDKTLEQYSFQYDKMGNKTGIQKSRQGDGSGMSAEMEQNLLRESGSYTYGYDSLNRLTEVKRNKKILHRYHYDAFGNRIGEESDNNKQNYHYNAANQLIARDGLSTRETYEYDKRGNLTAILSNANIINQYTYDETNRLAKAMNQKGETAVYRYDGLGNRVGVQEFLADVQSSVPLNPTKEIDFLLDRTKVYHNLLEKSEITEDGITKQAYTWDGNAAFMTEGETVHIYLQDELGSPVRLLEMGENRQTAYGYDAFGQDLFGNQGEVQPFGYTGYRNDRIAGTYFAQAREYLPGIGRFAGEDIVKGRVKHPQTLNSYQYVLNQPLKYCDRNGALPEWLDVSESGAAEKIRENADNILEAARAFGVDPQVVAGVIYTEQSENVDIVDTLTDWVGFYGVIDMSVGIGQVRMTTAEELENLGHARRPPHANPESNPFGDFVDSNYDKMGELLGICKSTE